MKILKIIQNYRSVKNFENRIISRNFGIQWPPRTCDLTLPDFFLWGDIKRNAYSNSPATIEELKRNIEFQFENIHPAVLESTAQNMVARANLCIEQGGDHFEHLI